MPKKRKRRPRNAEETKRRILDSAEVEFASKGFPGARLSAIARDAGVQQALIHHYFDDKARLYREVIDRALGAITNEGWDILSRTVSSIQRSRSKKQTAETRPLVEAFVDLLQRFFLEHAAVMAIVRHEAAAGGTVALEVVRTRVKPVVDAVIAYLEGLRGAGELRSDVDVRQMSIASFSMIAFPMMERPLLDAVWPDAAREADFILHSRKEIVETLLLRLLPP